MPKLISFKNVDKTFYTKDKMTPVIKDLTFDLLDNQIVTLLGPSGCGKSTILNMISNLEKPNHGEIKVQGKLGYMFQKDNLLSWRNTYQNIILGLEVQKNITSKTEEYIDSLLKKYGLMEFKSYYPHELSGGMRQRVSLIRTLALAPDVLLLDEPLSALDAQTRLFVQDDIYKILKNEKKAALIVTHDISEAIALSDKIIILSKRPSTIQNVIKINFNGDLSPLQRRQNPQFNHYFTLVYKELNHENN